MQFVKKLMFASIALLAVVSVGSVREANAQNVLGDILKRMDTQYRSLSSLRAKVTMEKLNAQLGDTDRSEGEAIYKPNRGKDAFIRIDWKSPQTESLSVVNRQYVIYRPRLNTAYTGSVDNAKGNAKAGGALSFLNMSRAQLRANYEVSLVGEETITGGIRTWHLHLIPKTKQSYKNADLWVDKDGFPHQSMVTENNGDKTTVLLTSIEPNVQIDQSKFKIKLPGDVKMIK